MSTSYCEAYLTLVPMDLEHIGQIIAKSLKCLATKHTIGKQPEYQVYPFPEMCQITHLRNK